MWRYPGSQDVLLTDFSSSFGIFTSYYRHILFDLCPFLSQLGAMLEFFDSSAKLVGHSGSILLPEDDEITRKLAMLSKANVRDWVPLRPLVNSVTPNNAIFNC